MRAVVMRQYGGPEQLVVEECPQPRPGPSQVLIEVKAFGLNRVEMDMRRGLWGQVARIGGTECVGIVHTDPQGLLDPGRRVAALMGGLGHTLNGSYAEYTCAPASNVVPVESGLSWEQLAAVPASFATAWTCLHRNLQIASEQVLLIRGGTSALGQAAINIAVESGVRVLATTRNEARFLTLESLGVHQPLLETSSISEAVRKRYPEGVDAVLDIIGNRTILDSLRTVRRGGYVCLAGSLGGRPTLAGFDPLHDMPSAVHLSSFTSQMFGAPQFPVVDVPLQRIFDRVATGAYQAGPVQAFRLEQIQEAHHLMERNQANGKLVVCL